MINTLEERDRGAVRRDRYLCPTVIGRESELTTLRRLLETVRTNGGRTALIAGEAGIGKSRLVAETRSYAADNGFLVLDGACFPQDRETPYAPLLDLLRGRFAGLPTEAIAVAVGPFAAEIALLLPELGLSPSPAASVGDQALERRRLFAALTHCLITPARDQPVLVAVEDLHWCDDASLDLLFGLARQTAALPLLLVGTYRDDEIDGRLRDWLMQLNRERLSTEIHLTPLGSEESSAMVRAISGTERVVPDELIDAVHARADGNPFYIEELLKSSLAVEGSCTDVRRCSPGPAAERSVPPNLQTMVLQRVERLSANAAEVLRLAAVVGRRFEFDLIECLAGIDERMLLSILRELVEANLVVEEGRDRFAFRHALTREAVYTGMLARERAVLHRSVAEAAEQFSSPIAEQRLSDLAVHFFEAAHWEKALEYARRAGERARRLHAPHAAVELLSRALAAADYLSDRARDSRDEAGEPLVAAVYRARGRAFETLGDFERAREDCEAGLALARAAGARRLEWQLLLDLGKLWEGRDCSRAGDWYQEAVDVAHTLQDRGSLEQTLNRIGEWRVTSTDDPWTAMPLHEQALAIFEQLGDRQGMAATLLHLGVMRYHGGDLPGSIDDVRRAAEIFRALGHQRGLVSALTMLATRAGATEINPIDADTAEFEGGVRDGEEAIRRAREIGWRPGEALALFMLAVVLFEQGYYARSLELAQRSLELAREMGHHHWLAGAYCTLGNLHAELLALPEALAYIEQSLAFAQGVGSAVWQGLAITVRGRIHLRAGRLDAAAEALGPAPDPDRPIPAMSRWLLAHVHAQLALARNEPDRALRLLDRLAEAPVAGGRRREAPHLLLTRAQALTALGRCDEAAALLERTLEAARTKNSRPLLWRTHVARGRLFHLEGQDIAARREFTAARAVLDELAADLPDDLRVQFLANATAPLPRAYRVSPIRVSVQPDSVTAPKQDAATLVRVRPHQCDRDCAIVRAESEMTTPVDDVAGPSVRVLVVDPTEIVRQGLGRLLTGCAGIAVVGEATSGEAALSLARELRPDVVLLELLLPDGDGAEAARRLLELDDPPRVLVLTDTGDHERVRAAIGAGVIGYLLKDIRGDDLVRAIADAAAGRPAFHPDVQRYLMQQSSAVTAPPLAVLTERERGLMRCLARGRSNREIAAELGLTHGTVKVYVSGLLDKLGVADRTQAALLAARLDPARR